jgi:hypothetical protein
MKESTSYYYYTPLIQLFMRKLGNYGNTKNCGNYAPYKNLNISYMGIYASCKPVASLITGVNNNHFGLFESNVTFV